MGPDYTPDTHREGIDIFIKLVEETDTLDDHVVDAVDIELDLGTGVAVSETELSLSG